ncbi:DUF3010 family protein [Dongshaea marina]|uniref:DUF3010 family protein n=1 Tax=Dongshaea marina TaxID=2047966 RepID=UPI000D3E53F2|nr:DUF3010 family protein [Dongshaea marina]
MRVCGVELKGGEANICLLTLDGDVFDIPDCRQRKFAISDSNDTQQIRDFQFAFSKLLEDYQVEQVVIQQRDQRGKWAGSATSFKLESAIQLIPSVETELMAPTEIKAQLKKTPLYIDFRDTELKQFQEPAFVAAYAYLSKINKLKG